MSETTFTESDALLNLCPSPTPQSRSRLAAHAKEPAPPHVRRGYRGGPQWRPWCLPCSATGLAVAGWFYYPHKGAAGSGTYSNQQTKDAKKDICETFMMVDRAVVQNSKLKNPDNGGPIGALSVATAQRFAFYGGGAYLRDQVAKNPRPQPT